MKSKFIIILLISLVVIGGYGCTMADNKQITTATPEMTLNDRQISILKDLGLSTSYADLTLTQQNAIVAIEDMLEYADEKYSKKFAYAGYTQPGTGSIESMSAYPADGSKTTDTFTIKKTSTGYTDDYLSVLANKLLSQQIPQELKAIGSNVSTVALTRVIDATLTSAPSSIDDLKGHVNVSMSVFIYGAGFDENALKNYENDFVALMNAKGIKGAADMMVLKNDQTSEIDAFNYKNYLSNEYYALRETISF